MKRVIQKHLYCRNKHCGAELVKEEPFGICPSCRYMGRWGMFIGGIIVGILAAIMKLTN